MSSSDARATGSIMGWASSTTEVRDKRAFSSFWNRPLRYFAQRCERPKGVRAGVLDIWLVFILFGSKGHRETKGGAEMQSYSRGFAAKKKNEPTLPINRRWLPISRRWPSTNRRWQLTNKRLPAEQQSLAADANRQVQATEGLLSA